jgi:hypothetical protein
MSAEVLHCEKFRQVCLTQKPNINKKKQHLLPQAASLSVTNKMRKVPRCFTLQRFLEKEGHFFFLKNMGK